MNISKLKKLVEKSKLNKVQIAERCGFTRVTLDNALQGADVKVSTIETLAKVLGVSAATLFDDSDDVQSNNEAIEVYKQEIARLQSLLNNKKTTKVVVELDIDSDEFVKLGLKDKMVQVLDKNSNE